RMKIEVQAARAAKLGVPLHDKLVGYLPHYAPFAARWHQVFNMRDANPVLRKASQVLAGFSSRRSLPKWRPDTYRDRSDWRYNTGEQDTRAREVVLFADTFNRYFERENLDDTLAVLAAAGYRVYAPLPENPNERPLCCGRTFLAVGLVEEARREMQRTLDALAPYVARGIPVVGLEPSCLFTFRDEMSALFKGEAANALAANTLLLEEFIMREHKQGHFNPVLAPMPKKALLHGHCHQKAFNTMGAVEASLRLVPQLSVETVESSCCGMAGSFGYDAATIDVSLRMGELSLLPAVRRAPSDALIVADGTSCRHQIHDGCEREAIHVARVLKMSLDALPSD
ncbi:MAG TPA: FAD-binding oxidoreductase, partial [Pseudolabrys sp.]|nr:FAD-binding oxidoreductase [Pseudolabrys sp.]